MATELRWARVYRLDELTDLCWADLVSVALGDLRLTECSRMWSCEPAWGGGRCYCGKRKYPAAALGGEDG
jgi:hypothetical protein